MCSSKTFVARHGEQNADENCTIVAFDPNSTPMIWAFKVGPCELFLARNSPRERLYQIPNRVELAATIAIGINDFTRVVSPT